jgi:hypothetical protein
MPLFDPARRNSKAEPLTFGTPEDVRSTRLDQHAQRVASADSRVSTRTDPSTRLWQEEMQQRRRLRDEKGGAAAPVAAAVEPIRVAGSLVDHRLDEELVQMASERQRLGQKRLAEDARVAAEEANELGRRCAEIGPTMAAAVRPGAAQRVQRRWGESRASASAGSSLRVGEADGARRRLRLLVQAAKPAVDTGTTVVTDSLLLLLHAVPRRGGGGGSAVRVLRRRPTLQVLSRRRRQRQAVEAQRREQTVADAQQHAVRVEALASARPAVDARLGSAIQRRREENDERASARQRGGRTHEVERRAIDPEGRAPFARTHSAVVAQMTYHRRAVRSARPSVDCRGRARSRGAATAARPRWRPTLAPEGRLAAGGRFWPSESGLMAALHAHRTRLRTIQEREVKVAAKATKAREAAAMAAAARPAWRGKNHVQGGAGGHEPLPPDPAGDVYRLHDKRVKLARKRGGKLSHGWSDTGGDAWMAGQNLEKQRRQRAEARRRKEREAKVEREKQKAAERRARRPPPREVATDAFYWSQLSD